MFGVAGAQMRVTIDVEVNEAALLDAVERAAAGRRRDPADAGGKPEWIHGGF